MAVINNLPDFDSLPPVEGMPHGCAWGVFDSDGKKDHLGCLNLLTPSAVREACKEARDGVSISLNAPLDTVRIALNRKALTHKIINWNEKANFSALDDDIEFNTQCSTQWDSLLHYYHQPSGMGYNGNAPSKEQLEQPTLLYDQEKKLPTLDHWHDRGGIVGRGVLLDYRQYARAKGIRYQVFSDHTITTHDLEAIATYQGVQLKHGDILIIRSGYTEDLMNMTAEEQLQEMMATGGQIGVEGNLDSAKWFWNKHFSAVAGDMMAFEVYPPKKEDGTPGDASNLVLQPYFLSMFGLNIGELWNLKALGEHCTRTKRYSFLLTSIPLNIPGLVGSPANALAIF